MTTLLFILLSGSAFATELQGKWKGYYEYQNGNRVNFEATVQQSGTRISGEIREPNTFGSAEVSELISNVSGTTNDSQVSFRKTYSGWGGQSHSVDYAGVLSGKQLEGTWKIDPANSGRFYMEQETGKGAEGPAPSGPQQGKQVLIRAN